jgi:hypothetical protein
MVVVEPAFIGFGTDLVFLVHSPCASEVALKYAQMAKADPPVGDFRSQFHRAPVGVFRFCVVMQERPAIANHGIMAPRNGRPVFCHFEPVQSTVWLPERDKGPADETRDAFFWSAGFDRSKLFLQRLGKLVPMKKYPS